MAERFIVASSTGETVINAYSTEDIWMITQEQIGEIVETIASNHSPEKIILFGSYAYGTPGEDSDLDLLVNS